MNRRKALLAIFILTAIFLSGCGISLRSNVKVLQKNKTTLPDTATDDDLLSLTIDDVQLDKDYIDQNAIDKVEITAIMIDEYNRPMKLVKKAYGNTEINADGKVKFDFKNFGKHEVTISYYKGNKCLRTQLTDIIFTSDEYNIGFLRATLPPTYFTLLMTQKNDTVAFNEKLPTIVSLDRPKSYDWDNLYPNMYPNPFSDYQKFEILDMQSYVGYLYSLNPKSKFHFYFCDLFTLFLPQLAYENNIPEANFDVTFFSDGTGTYSCFRSIFGNVEDPQNPSMAKYEEYKKAWASAKAKAKKGDTSYINEVRRIYPKDSLTSEYGLITAIVTDSAINARWIVNRKNADTFGQSDVAKYIFLNKEGDIGKNLIEVNMYKDIAKKITDTAKLEKLKKLYKLNLDEIEKADEEGKKVMIFIGGRTDIDNMRDYALFMINYTKKIWNPSADYAFFYKGHPGEVFNEERNKVNADILEYGVKTLDSSIPAELFFLFRPEVEMCGMSSSTFQSYPHDLVSFIIDVKPSAMTSDVQTIIKSAKRADGSYIMTTTKDGSTVNYSWHPDNPEEFKPEEPSNPEQGNPEPSST